MTAQVSARMRECSVALAMLVLLPFSAALHAQDAAHAASAPKPEKLWAAQTSASGITLNWGAMSGVLGYLLHCAGGDEAPRLVGRPASNSNQWQLQIGGGMLGQVQRCFLQVQTAKGLSEMVAFNPVVPAKAAAQPAAPASVTATQSAPEEITLTWSEVPGATAYFLARSVGNDGYRVLCQLCPVTPTYVDRDVATGVRYSYAVAAVSPGGTSRRTNSNSLITETAIALGDEESGDTDTSGGAATDGTSGGGVSTTGGGASTSGGSGGAPSGGTGGASPGGNPGGWTPGGTSTGGTPGGTPTGGSAGGTPSTTSGTGSSGGTGSSSGGTPESTRPCTLEYQRADNMWAALGRPDGDLGVERITLEPRQTRAFVTDWKYEKSRSDGSNYYGSHLRIARNAGDRPVMFQMRGETESTMPVPGVAIDPYLNASQVTLEPGKTLRVKGDLMEVACGVKGR